MIKLIIFLKKSPNLSLHEFREKYENTHAKTGVELFGDLFATYSRNYVTKILTTPTSDNIGDGSGFDYDAFAEITFETQEDLDEWAFRCQQPNIKSAMVADENALFDRNSITTIIVDEVS